MYLWCSQCNHATPEASWTRTNHKYGVCPKCGCSSYRNAIEWEMIAAANNYPYVPDEKEIYLSHPGIVLI